MNGRGAKNVSQIVSIKAGIGGLNGRDALSAMDPTDAVILDNWDVIGGGLRPRTGYTSWSIDVGSGTAPVEFLRQWSGGASRKLIAGCDGELWDCSDIGAATSLQDGFGSNRWNAAMFGGVLTLVNGIDGPQKYDGSVISAVTWTGSGLTATNLANVCVYRSRLYFVETGTLNCWYGGTGAIQGALDKFDLGQIVAYGGTLLAILTWTRDTGTGSQEFLVFVTSEGEILVYGGPDPADDTFTITNRFKVGSPLSDRSFVKVGGDQIIMTVDDWSPLSALLAAGFQMQQSALSNKISQIQGDTATLYAGNFGWEAVHYPNGSRIIFNVPVFAATKQIQYVFNTVNGTWSSWSGINASCFAIYKDHLFWGSNDGRVYRGDDGNSDNGATIISDIQMAFSDLGYPGVYKTNCMVRPVFQADAAVSFSMIANVDYSVNPPTSAISTQGASVTLWDPVSWDAWTAWNTAAAAQTAWYGGSGGGFTVGPRLSLSSKDINFTLMGFDVLFQAGGYL